MVFKCILCQKESCYYYNLCSKCERIKDYLSLYDDRVYEVLDSVLSRDKDKQENKVNVEIQKEINDKEVSLKKKKQKVKFASTD
tara:strand:- start:599 stop:850 length:252 start_codon:yes stop_codon:yes gene_type:complete